MSNLATTNAGSEAGVDAVDGAAAAHVTAVNNSNGAPAAAVFVGGDKRVAKSEACQTPAYDAHAKQMATTLDSTTTTATTATTSTSTSTSTSTFNANLDTEKTPIAIHYLASFHQICIVTALLPLVTLLTCFVTAYIFQYDDVHETHCRVYNIVPSISAITGVSPQRYFWRFSIALHIGPRIPIAFVYKNYYHSLLPRLAPHQVTKTRLLITLILVLNCIEVASLGGVTYISNRENYPIHEKIFITFMICSLCYMLATIKLNGILHATETLSENQRLSIKWKKILFASSILSTIGLLIFFAKHRFYCHDLAFSWFAFFEYLIAISNMLYHFTIIWDFPSQYMLIVQAPRSKLEQFLSASTSTSASITASASKKRN